MGQGLSWKFIFVKSPLSCTCKLGLYGLSGSWPTCTLARLANVLCVYFLSRVVFTSYSLLNVCFIRSQNIVITKFVIKCLDMLTDILSRNIFFLLFCTYTMLPDTKSADAFSGIIPPSPEEYPILGLNLLRLLVQNRIAEFHTELELLPSKALENLCIKHGIELEQSFMEGAYNRVLSARQAVPHETYIYFMDLLAKTVRLVVSAATSSCLICRFTDQIDDYLLYHSLCSPSLFIFLLQVQRWNSWMQREGIWLLVNKRCEANVYVQLWQRTATVYRRGKSHFRQPFIPWCELHDITVCSKYHIVINRSTLSGMLRTAWSCSKRRRSPSPARIYPRHRSSTRASATRGNWKWLCDLLFVILYLVRSWCYVSIRVWGSVMAASDSEFHSKRWITGLSCNSVVFR